MLKYEELSCMLRNLECFHLISIPDVLTFINTNHAHAV
jgi:hypothetical protein